MITIKNIIFDLGNVILKGKPRSVLECFDLEKRNELNKFFDDWTALDLGKETLQEKYNKCSFPKDIRKDYKDILIHYYEYRKINQDLIGLINKLKENKYNIYVLSDNNKESIAYYKNNELFKNIDDWIISCDYGTEKKDELLFDIMIKKLNLNTNECYFIDDNIDNIEIAKKHGIKGFVFNNSINDLINDMKDNGINIY